MKGELLKGEKLLIICILFKVNRIAKSRYHSLKNKTKNPRKNSVPEIRGTWIRTKELQVMANIHFVINMRSSRLVVFI